MKSLFGLLAIAGLISSCGASYQSSYSGNYSDPPITQSLFSDKSSTISEENIQKILDGNYSLPKQWSRVQNEAVLLTINEIGEQVTKFLSKEQ